MNLRIGRHFKEAVTNLWRNKWMNTVVVMSVFFTLLLMGSFISVYMNVGQLMGNIEDNVEIVVYVEKGLETEQVNQLGDRLRVLDSVEEVEFIHKDDGLDNLIDRIDEHGVAFEGLREDNPLNHVYVVKVDETEYVEGLSDEIDQLEYVEEADYGEEIVVVMTTITNVINNIGLFLVSGLTLITVFLMMITIQLTIQRRNDEIKVMRLVGATRTFISIPFILEGILISVFGAVLAISTISVVYQNMYSMLGVSLGMNEAAGFLKMVGHVDVLIVVASVLMAVAVSIGALGSIWSMRKNLNV